MAAKERMLGPMATHRARSAPTSPFFNRTTSPAAVRQFEVGERVTHDNYGLGRVIGVEPGIATMVDFGDRVVRIPVTSRALYLL